MYVLTFKGVLILVKFEDRENFCAIVGSEEQIKSYAGFLDLDGDNTLKPRKAEDYDLSGIETVEIICENGFFQKELHYDFIEKVEVKYSIDVINAANRVVKMVDHVQFDDAFRKVSSDYNLSAVEMDQVERLALEKLKS